VLVLGATGMLGTAVVRVLSESSNLVVFGTVRTESSKRFFNEAIAKNLLAGVDVEQQDSLEQAFNIARPNIVINCVGLIKQLSGVADPLQVIPINALLPHRLAYLCKDISARLIHISTDCVFDGSRGRYRETDSFDAKDLYGISKYLGEVSYAHTITLRTSIIGHELQSAHSLVSWFLSQEAKCKGYKKAIFSGLPTVVLAQIIRDVVIPHKKLSGIYHIAAQPINKFDLLTLISEIYRKSIQIIADENVVINRSLNATKFHDVTGYVVPEWPELVRTMHAYK
jgi:dTDP-4-dehydrorhamnose reductase